MRPAWVRFWRVAGAGDSPRPDAPGNMTAMPTLAADGAGTRIRRHHEEPQDA
jgi:hypothetical protein